MMDIQWVCVKCNHEFVESAFIKDGSCCHKCGGAVFPKSEVEHCLGKLKDKHAIRGCKIEISTSLLLEWLGLKQGTEIKLAEARVKANGYGHQVLSLTLVGTDKRLPEVQEGNDFPNASIICRTIESNIKVI